MLAQPFLDEILIGVTEIPLTKRAGVFRCPGCRTLRPYKWRGIRRFLTIYFVPVIPLTEVSEHVRCSICRNQFSPRVLAGGPLSVRLDSNTVSGAVIVAAMRLVLADGRTTRAEILELQRLIRDRTGIESGTEDIIALRNWVAGDSAPSAADWLMRARAMSDRQCQRAVRDLFQVASADGDLRPLQVLELTELPNRLAITPKRFRRLVQEACMVATVDDGGLSDP